MMQIPSDIKQSKEAGYSLLELLIVITVSAMVLGLIVSSIFQLRSGQKQVTDNNFAIRQLQNLNHWLGKDVLTAQAIDTVNDLEPPEEKLLTLSYSFQGTGSLEDYQYQYYVYYSYDGDIVWRNIRTVSTEYDSSGQVIGNWETSNQLKIAQNVSDLSVDVENGVVQVLAKAVVNKHTEVQGFTFQKRAEG